MAPRDQAQINHRDVLPPDGNNKSAVLGLDQRLWPTYFEGRLDIHTEQFAANTHNHQLKQRLRRGLLKCIEW